MLLRAAVVGAALLSVAGCVTGGPCDAVSCPVGCCDARGLCQVSSEISCGTKGATCNTCLRGERCLAGFCTMVGQGGGTFTGFGGGGGSFGGGTGGSFGGGTGGGSNSFAITLLDSSARDALTFAIAVEPFGQRVGVAYFTPAGTETMPGVPDFALQYLEWNGGQVSPPQTLQIVQRIVGVSVAFEPLTGDPVVAYLGGSAGMSAGQPTYWFQSDAVISRRTNGVWTETTVARSGDQVSCGNATSDRGYLVGLWPALTFDSSGRLYFGYRDGHDADFGNSDVEVWEGTLPLMGGVCATAGNAAGGHLSMTMGNAGQPALIFDQQFSSATGPGANVLFQKRSPSGTWSAPTTLLIVSDTQTGAALAWDSLEGYGMAAFDRAPNSLSYTHSLDGVAWTAIEPVFEAGTGGFYPSLAMDPINHEPVVAFYVCAVSSGISEANCRQEEDELRLTQRVAGVWRDVLVDPEGGYLPKVGVFSSGKRFVVYRTPPALDPMMQTPFDVGALKIAVER